MVVLFPLNGILVDLCEENDLPRKIPEYMGFLVHLV